MNIGEKAAYLQGLLEGMKLDQSVPANKLLAEIVSLLSDVTEVVTDIKEETEALNEIIEDIDGDLDELEDFVYNDFHFSDDVFNEIKCPECGCTVVFDDSDDPLDIICGNCGVHIDTENEIDDEDSNTQV